MSELPLLVKLGSTTKERHLLIDTNQFTYICNNQNNKVAYCLCWQAKVEEDDEGYDEEIEIYNTYVQEDISLRL